MDPATVQAVDYAIGTEMNPNVLTTFHGLHPESVAAGLVRNPGIVATAQHCVNAIPAVCAAAPGIRTYLDLPAYHGRAAGHLAGA
jgi:hypothetical protein